MSPHGLFSLWCAICLFWMGRLSESFQAFARSREIAAEDDTPELACIALAFESEASYYGHDADRALATARQADELVRRLGERDPLVAWTQIAFACAHLAAGRAADAIESARVALALHHRVEKANAGSAAMLLAEALLAAGDLPAAHAAAEEAIALCRRSLRANYEAGAHGVIARVLLRRDGAAARADIEAALGEAAALIDRSGGRVHAPALMEWRAELAAVLGDDAARVQLLGEARALYEQIGAPLQAVRIAALLGASVA